jgi:hypothetical protein
LISSEYFTGAIKPSKGSQNYLLIFRKSCQLDFFCELWNTFSQLFLILSESQPLAINFATDRKMVMSGYFFDPKAFNERVKGYKELSPKEKWGLWTLIHMMAAIDSYQINDNDILFMSETGFTKKEWISVKQKLMTIDQRLLALNDGVWVSRWLKQQKQPEALPLPEPEHEEKIETSSVAVEIQPFNSKVTGNLEIERSILADEKSRSVFGSSTEYARKVNDELLRIVTGNK